MWGKRLTLFGLVALSIRCGGASPIPNAPSGVTAIAVAPTRMVDLGHQTLAPDHVLSDQFESELDRAVRKAFHSYGASLMAKPIKNLISVGISTRPAGTYTVPIQGGTQVSVDAGLAVATLTINLNLADKLAIGNHLTISSYFSPDGLTNWAFANGTTWTSYGPGGFTVTDPDGTVRVNPDPRLQIPLGIRTGQFIRLELILPQTLDAGATIDVQ